MVRFNTNYDLYQLRAANWRDEDVQNRKNPNLGYYKSGVDQGDWTELHHDSHERRRHGLEIQTNPNLGYKHGVNFQEPTSHHFSEISLIRIVRVPGIDLIYFELATGTLRINSSKASQSYTNGSGSTSIADF
ncbi:hypothetical protein L1887_23199 [Cichorium endivia]|nr:hypothetical protein L1887_23199 [Cichorium endivia]